MNHKADIQVLRELATRFREAAEGQDRERTKTLWRRLHDRDMERPMIHIWAIIFTEELDEITNLQCSHPLFREKEKELRTELLHHHLGDDYLLEPYISLRASHVGLDRGYWGVSYPVNHAPGGASDMYADPPLKSLDDLSPIQPIEHRIDEEQTAENRRLLEDAVGDILPIHVTRAPIYHYELIAPTLTNMRGLGQIMMDLLEDPEGLHRVLRFMQEAVIAAHEKAAELGHLTTPDQYIQSCSYSSYTADPEADAPATREDLWCFMHTQEFTGVSPAMHKEFSLDYQRPIMETFAASAYGCCEDLTRKIDMLREVRNLRQISVNPAADLEQCAEQIGSDYVVSWRPNPTDHFCPSFDPERVRREVARAHEILQRHGCHYEINLKDVMTVDGDRDRLREWVQAVRSVVDGG